MFYHLSMITLIKIDDPQDEFLKDMVYEMVFFLDKSKKPPKEELLAIPEISRYYNLFAGHGEGFIALVDGQRAGAAWYLNFPLQQKGYGHVKYGVPELSIAVLEKYRCMGVGTKLMEELITLARKNGFPGVSLSVDTVNPACRLYERLGFKLHSIDGTSQTMTLEFS